MASKRRLSREPRNPWPGNPTDSAEALIARFGVVTYRGIEVDDVRVEAQPTGALLVFGRVRLERRIVTVQGYEVVKRQGRRTTTTIFWGQLDKTVADDPRLAYEEGLYPNQEPDPSVSFITAWASS